MIKDKPTIKLNVRAIKVDLLPFPTLERTQGRGRYSKV